MNLERELASVRRISSLQPIPGADKIELAIIDGWQCVVGKDVGHKVGDLVIYYEIDSFLPGTDTRYESFRERFIKFNGVEGLRVKTIRLRKQLSQGVVMPVREFPEIKNPKEGQDVTALLKITKWESPEEAKMNAPGLRSGKSAGVFPQFLPKTCQPRAQNIGPVLAQSLEKGELFERTIKLHGSSMTVFKVTKDSKFYPEALRVKLRQEKRTSLLQRLVHWYKLKFNKYTAPVFGVCSRNILLKDHDGSDFWKVTEEQKLIEKLDKLDGSYALQGEIIGPNIQAGFEKAKTLEFRLFDIFDIKTQKYLLPTERASITKVLDVLHTPVDAILPLHEVGPAVTAETLVNDLLKAAEGPGMNPGVKREGHVYKSMNNPEFSFKVVANSFLESKAG